jgi:hypothetical protein
MENFCHFLKVIQKTLNFLDALTFNINIIKVLEKLLMLFKISELKLGWDERI